MRSLFFFSLFITSWANAQVLVSAKSNGKYGLLNGDGQWHLAATYDSLGSFYHQTVAYAVRGKWGLLSAEGKVISPAVWADISYEEERKVAVFDGTYWGYISLSGKTIIEPQFLEADDFHEGLAGASKLEDNWGFIDSTGRWVIPPQFTFVAEFIDGLAYVEDEEESFYINIKGERQGPATRQSANYRDITPTNKMGIRKTSGTWLVQPNYDNLSLRSGATYFFYKDGKWGLLDTTNAILFANKLEQFRPFSDGLAPVKLNGKWGYINRKGDMVVPAIFDEALPFSYGKGVVLFNGKWGVIGTDGNFLIPPRFENILGRFQKLDPKESASWEVELD